MLSFVPQPNLRKLNVCRQKNCKGVTQQIMRQVFPFNQLPIRKNIPKVINQIIGNIQHTDSFEKGFSHRQERRK